MSAKHIPLVEYWTSKMPIAGRASKSFPSPPPGPSSDYDRYLSERGAMEREAWRELCSEVVKGRIRVWAFRHVSKPEARDWYPDFPESTLREEVPQEFFADPEVIYIGPGPDRVVLYWMDNRLGGPTNAPWVMPTVTIVSRAQLVSMAELERFVADYRRDFPDATRAKLESDLVEHFPGANVRETVRKILAPAKRGRRPRGISKKS